MQNFNLDIQEGNVEESSPRLVPEELTNEELLEPAQKCMSEEETRDKLQEKKKK